MYSDDISNLKEQFTRDELTAAITVKLIERKMQWIIRKQEESDTLAGELCSW